MREERVGRWGPAVIMIKVLIIFSEAIMPLDIIFWKVFKSAGKCKQWGRIGTNL